MDKLIAHFLLTKLLLALWLVVTLPIWFSCRWSGIGSRRGPREEMKMITPANEQPGVDASWPLLLASKCPRPGITQAERLAKHL